MLKDHAASSLHPHALPPRDRDVERLHCTGKWLGQAREHDAIALCGVRLAGSFLVRGPGVLLPERMQVLAAMLCTRPSHICGESWGNFTTRRRDMFIKDREGSTASSQLELFVGTAERHAMGIFCPQPNAVVVSGVILQSRAMLMLKIRFAAGVGAGQGCRGQTHCQERNGARWQRRPRFVASCGDSSTWRCGSRPPLPEAASAAEPPLTATMRAMCTGASGSAGLLTCSVH